jgi:hypothetical protein
MYTEVSDSFRIAAENGHYSRLEGRVVGVATYTSTMLSYVKCGVKPYHFVDVDISWIILCMLQRAGVCNKHVIIYQDKSI